MELQESTFLTSDYTTNLQSSRQYGTGTKTTINQWNKTESPKIKPGTHAQLIFGKGGKNIYIDNRENTVSLTSGAGKTGQPRVKE